MKGKYLKKQETNKLTEEIDLLFDNLNMKQLNKKKKLNEGVCPSEIECLLKLSSNINIK